MTDPTREALARLRQRPEFRFAATTDDFADALAAALSTTPAPLDVARELIHIRGAHNPTSTTPAPDRPVYRITGFQPSDAPHWSVALIEADTADDARAALLSVLTGNERPDEVWGWDDDLPAGSYRDPAEWEADISPRPVRFVLGGGCR